LKADIVYVPEIHPSTYVSASSGGIITMVLRFLVLEQTLLDQKSSLPKDGTVEMKGTTVIV